MGRMYCSPARFPVLLRRSLPYPSSTNIHLQIYSSLPPSLPPSLPHSLPPFPGALELIDQDRPECGVELGNVILKIGTDEDVAYDLVRSFVPASLPSFISSSLPPSLPPSPGSSPAYRGSEGS